MRSPMVKHAVTIVLMSLMVVAAAYAQTRTRTSPRSRSRAEWQQNQMAQQTGQPDFARRIAERNARHMQEMQQDMEEMRRWAEENKNRSIQQALRATDEQWLRIRPKLERIERLKAEAEVAAGPGSSGNSGNGNFQGQAFMFGGSAGGFGGGSGSAGSMGMGAVDIMDPNGSAGVQSNSNGWGGSWTSGSKSRMEMTEGEILCDELQHLLQGESVAPAEVAQKLAALRRVRAQARDDLTRTRMELRGLISPQQEPALVVMGYLD